MNSERMTVQQYIPLAAATAGTAADLFVVYGGNGKAKVARVDYVSDGGITANDTNYATLTVTVAGTSLGSFSTTAAGTGDIADGAVESVTLSGAGSNLVSEGGAVKLAITKVASGVAMSGGIAVTFERVRAD